MSLKLMVEEHRSLGLSWPFYPAQKPNGDDGELEKYLIDGVPWWKILETKRLIAVHESWNTQKADRAAIGDDNIKRGWGADYIAQPYGADPRDWASISYDAKSEMDSPHGLNDSLAWQNAEAE